MRLRQAGRRSSSGTESANGRSGDGRWTNLPGEIELIEEMDRELTKVIEDLDGATNIEGLRLTRQTGKHSLHLSGVGSFSIAS